VTSTIKGCMRLGRAPWTTTLEVGFGCWKVDFLDNPQCVGEILC
jgi:hypothetical protein